MRQTRLWWRGAMLMLLIAPFILSSPGAARMLDEPSSSRIPQQQFTIFLPMVRSAEPEELAIMDPLQTTPWTPQHTGGIAVRHPASWQVSIGDSRLTGIDGILLQAPCLSSRSGACSHPAPTTTLRVLSRPLIAEQDVPSDFVRAAFLRRGFHQRFVTIQGIAAWLLEPSGTSEQADSVLVVVFADREYTLFLGSAFRTDSAFRTQAGLLLGTLQFDARVTQAAITESFTALQSRPIIPAFPKTMNLAPWRQLLLEEALLYGPQMTNRDGCYLYVNEVWARSCFNNLVGGYEIDGAHFIDCVLAYANVENARCRQLESHLSFDSIKQNILDPLGAQQIDPEDVQIGDLFLAYDVDKEYYCWGGLIVNVGVNNISGFHAAVHSITLNSQVTNIINADPGELLCERNGNLFAPELQYFSLNLDQTPPYLAWLTEDQFVLPVGLIFDLEWEGYDEPEGSGLESITLHGSLGDGTDGLLYKGTNQSYAITPRHPCQTLSYSLTARDMAGNETAELPLQMTTTLRGDVDRDGTITDVDLDLVDATWDSAWQVDELLPMIDFNENNLFDQADMLWHHLRGGHTCTP